MLAAPHPEPGRGPASTESAWPVRLADIPIADREGDVAAYAALPVVARLCWPPEVIEQWLYDHADHGPFLDDYATLDLAAVSWQLETVAVGDLVRVRTGPSEQSFLEEVAELHDHFLSLRPAEIRADWNSNGTWLVPPILLEMPRKNASINRLQLVEGRMRVGILQGRLHAGLHVAASHTAWVGRGRAPAPLGERSTMPR